MTRGRRVAVVLITIVPITIVACQKCFTHLQTVCQKCNNWHWKISILGDVRGQNGDAGHPLISSVGNFWVALCQEIPTCCPNFLYA